MVQSKVVDAQIDLVNFMNQESHSLYILIVKHMLYITYRKLIKSNFDYHKLHYNNIKSVHVT